MPFIEQQPETHRRLRSFRLEAGLLALVACLAAVAVWSVVTDFGAELSPAGLPAVVLGSAPASAGQGQRAPDSASTSGLTQSSAPTSTVAASLSGTTLTTAAQTAQGQASAGRTVVTQRLRTNYPGSGQESGGGGPPSGQGR